MGHRQPPVHTALQGDPEPTILEEYLEVDLEVEEEYLELVEEFLEVDLEVEVEVGEEYLEEDLEVVEECLEVVVYLGEMCPMLLT